MLCLEYGCVLYVFISLLQDKRYHIVEELFRNEKEYVEALKMLKEVSPSKHSAQYDPTPSVGISLLGHICRNCACYIVLVPWVKCWKSKHQWNLVCQTVHAVWKWQFVKTCLDRTIEQYITVGTFQQRSVFVYLVTISRLKAMISHPLTLVLVKNNAAGTTTFITRLHSMLGLFSATILKQELVFCSPQCRIQHKPEAL